MKNQIEMRLSCEGESSLLLTFESDLLLVAVSTGILLLPKDDVQDHEHRTDNDRPEHRPLVERKIALARQRTGPVNQAGKFSHRLGSRRETYNHGHGHANQPGPKSPVH